jgi:hypothetical protein
LPTACAAILPDLPTDAIWTLDQSADVSGLASLAVPAT